MEGRVGINQAAKEYAEGLLAYDERVQQRCGVGPTIA